MFKKKNLFLLLLGFFILDSDTCASSQTHTYIGAQLGYGAGGSQVKSDYANVYFGPFATGSDRTVQAKLGTTGLLGGLHAGVGSAFGGISYLGLELSANLANVEGSREGLVSAAPNITDSLSLKMKKSFGLALKTGVYFHQKTLAFVKLAVSRAQFRMDTRLSDAKEKLREYKTGFNPGVGMQTDVSKNVTVGVEFSYAFYSPLKINQSVPQPGLQNASITHTAKPKMAAFQLSLSYKI